MMYLLQTTTKLFFWRLLVEFELKFYLHKIRYVVEIISRIEIFRIPVKQEPSYEKVQVSWRYDVVSSWPNDPNKILYYRIKMCCVAKDFPFTNIQLLCITFLLVYVDWKCSGRDDEEGNRNFHWPLTNQ